MPSDIPPETPLSDNSVAGNPVTSTPVTDSSSSKPPADQLLMDSEPGSVEQTAKKGSGLLAKVKTGLSALLLIAISGGIGYGIGNLQTRGQVKTIRAEKEVALAEVQEQLAGADARVVAAEARSSYTRVQLLLLESVDELEQRNFGNANTQLRLASEILSQIDVSPNPDKLAQLQEELSTAEINFAVNPVEQRKVMLDYSEQINSLLPE